VREAVFILRSSTKENDFAGHLMSLVDINDVRNAINNNDYNLALSNFNKIKDFIVEIAIEGWNCDTINSSTIKGLEIILNNPNKNFFEKKTYKKFVEEEVNGFYHSRFVEEEVPNNVVGKWLATYAQGNNEGAENFLIRIGNTKQ
jgi:hypothetical protein